MKIKNIIIAFALVLLFTSCNDDEVYEKEQYKNVFALISGSDNIQTKYLDFRKEESFGYISFSMGGTNPTTEDLTINIVEDKSYIDEYNRVTHDMDVLKYTRALPKDKYDIETLQCKIPAGEIGGQIPVRLRPEGLSPDSSYFIAVRVDTYSNYEINPSKNHLLYRLRVKNYWAKGDGTTGYTLSGRLTIGNANPLTIPGTKTMHPLSANKVRVMAGNETYKSDRATLNKSAIVLEVDENNKVTITPYKDIEVTQIDGDPNYPNLFMVYNDGFKTYKTFLLHYKYRLNNTNYSIQEEIRLQFNPDEEKDEEII